MLAISPSRCLPHPALQVMNAYSRQGVAEMGREVKVLSSVSHPHIVQLLGVCNEPGCQALVYELMEAGSLDRALGLGEEKADGAAALAWRERVRIAWEVATALVWLHSDKIPIYHMDIKPSNILLDRLVDAPRAACSHNSCQQLNAAPTIHITHTVAHTITTHCTPHTTARSRPS
jgi:serine/threonine protein kinase